MIAALVSPGSGLCPASGPAARGAAPCTASELDAGSLSCDLACSAKSGKITVRACPSAVSDPGPGLRLAGPAGPEPGVQGCGDHGAASRGDGASPPGCPAQAGLGRPGGTAGIGPAAARRAAGQPAGYAGDPAGLASPADHPQVDLPEPPWPPGGRPGALRPGAAAGAGESGLGIPPGARRADPPRPSDQRADCPADPPRPRLPAGSARPGHLLADVPACQGRGPAGVRLLHRGHDLPAAAVRAVRHGDRHPAGSCPRGDPAPGWRLVRPAGPQPGHRPDRPDRLVLVPHPGPRRQVHGRVRGCLHQRGHKSGEVPAAGAQSETSGCILHLFGAIRG